MTRTRAIYFLGAILLAASIGIPAWLLSRPKAVKDPGPSVETLDIVCTGRVDGESKVVPLDGQAPGRVVKIHVKEGDQVKAGQPLVSLDDRAFGEMVKDANLAREAARLEVEAAEAKIKTNAADLEALQLRIDAAKIRATAAAGKIAQMKQQMGVSGAVPITQADIDLQEGELRSLRLNIDAEQIRLTAFKAVDPELEKRGAEKRVEAANQNLLKAQRYQKDCVITAPSDGMIVRMQCGEGAMLGPNPIDPGIVFAPSGPLIVRAEVEQSDIGRIVMGMPATVNDDSRVQSTWKGRVTAISRWMAPKRAILLDPGNFNDVRTTEVIITLDPNQKPLWIGQRMVVRFGK